MSNSLPPDDPSRDLTVARPDSDQGLEHLAVVGDTYTVLLRGRYTGGRFALIDMLVPPGGGPPPHRHAFEEAFHVLEGEIEVSLRQDRALRLGAGETVNVPANAPHSFRNPSEEQTRLLCFVSPAGLEDYFAEFGDPLPSRTSPAPALSETERAQRMARAVELAPGYGIENL